MLQHYSSLNKGLMNLAASNRIKRTHKAAKGILCPTPARTDNCEHQQFPAHSFSLP